MSQVKIKVLLLTFSIMFLGVIARLGYWQVVKGGELAIKAKAQYQSSEIKSAPRGSILASDGSYLVVRKETWIPFVNPQKFKSNPGVVAEKLSEILGKDQAPIEEILKKKEGQWLRLDNEIDFEKKENIEKLNVMGIGFDSSEGRSYPEASAGAQLLGFMGKDEAGMDIGYFGLEGYYNLALSGKSGFNKNAVDASGTQILSSENESFGLISGVDLETSIDKRIQILVNSKLKEGIERYGAKSGSVIVMNPKNGNILAMESFPSFDPQKYSDYNDSLFKNPVISNSFEPGSIFKVVVMASGLDSGVVKPDTKCDICSGPLKVDKYSIETWNKEYHTDATMTDVIVHSDNVGMAFVGQKLGEDRLYDYLDKFGFGQETGIDLQGEVSPKLRKKGSWNIVDLVTATFGQGIAVTPIQMIRAVGAIANDGLMVTPKVVEKIKGDGWEDLVPQGERKRVISSRAAKEITAMMVEAAKNGESKWTSLKGFKVAGKTGTAQIPIAGHYDATKTNASFIGFAPYDDPEFIMLVILSEPESSQWASETAAPLWYSIAKELFIYFGIMPEN